MESVRPDPGPTQGPLPIGAEVRSRAAFRLDRWLGGGSFGAVYLATTLHAADTGAPEQVAVKVFGGEISEKARRHALQRELSALKAIACRRIPRVFDADVAGRDPFLAMEYFAHGTLEDLLRRVGALDEREALALFESLLEALVAAHGAGVLHLDIKPANVLLDGAGGFVLTDFGLAQAPRMGRKLPMPGLGSEGWQAPEQERRLRGTFDLRTDLFGVGATLWAALTGVDLGSRTGLVQRQRAARSGIALPPVSVRRPCAPEIEAVVMSLLARDPGARPGSAGEVLEQVRALRAGRGIDLALPGREVGADELAAVVAGIVDPLVASIFEHEHRGVRRLADGQLLCAEGEHSHHAYVLIKGAVAIVRDGERIARVDREGAFLGEIAAFTGEPRNASMVAEGEAWVRVLNAAQLERLVMENPALAVRLIRTMAQRFKYTVRRARGEEVHEE